MTFRSFLGVLLIFFSYNVFSNYYCVENVNEIGLMGLDSSTGTVYADIKNDEVSTCGCNSVRFPATQTETKMALSILMTAKVASLPVRIDIIKENDVVECNRANRVYLN